jgi:hypothetical protein
MSKRKLNTDQNIGVLKQLEAGRTAVELERADPRKSKGAQRS